MFALTNSGLCLAEAHVDLVWRVLVEGALTPETAGELRPFEVRLVQTGETPLPTDCRCFPFALHRHTRLFCPNSNHPKEMAGLSASWKIRNVQKPERKRCAIAFRRPVRSRRKGSGPNASTYAALNSVSRSCDSSFPFVCSPVECFRRMRHTLLPSLNPSLAACL